MTPRIAHPRTGRWAPATLVLTLLTALAGLAGGYAPTAHAAAAASGACSVDYSLNEWTGGFTANVTVTNNGPAVTSWTLGWTYGGDQKITSAWNATVTQSGTAVTAASLAYNGSLATGGSTTFGFQGTWNASDPKPTAYTFNGTSCSGSTTTGGTTAGSTTGSTTSGTTGSTTSGTTGSTTSGTTGSTTAGTTGSTTSGTTGSTTGGTGTGGCGAGTVVCSGFEDQTGSTPSGNWTVTAPDCQGAGTATIDTTVAHSGSRSLRINGAAGYCNHIFAATTANVASVGPVVYARMWIRHTTALPAAHIAMVTMADSNNNNTDLRLGGQNGALQWNRQSDDATLPAQSPAGVAQSTPLPTNQWVCLQYAVDTTKQSMDTWVNGTEVPGLHVDGVPTQDIDQQWLSRTVAPRPTTLRLGWEAYGTGDDTVWYDDVALGNQPIACS
jgi:hypothetical protein